jgi:type II secretory pathway predicted ATPase ExeA
MYEAFYGLRRRPFDLTTDPAFFIATPSHREALNSMAYAIATAKPVMLLLGEAGTGKTTVVTTAAARQARRAHCVVLENPALTRKEFVQLLAAKLALSPRARESKADLLLELEMLLERRVAEGEQTVLVVDEAQTLPPDLLEEVRLLTNFAVGGRRPLSLVLSGHPELSDRLNDPEWRHLKQRVALRCELRPLTPKETFTYVAGRLLAAGGNPAQMFTREAVVLLHRFSSGIARTMNVIADNALLDAFASGLPTVTSHVVCKVCKDLELRATPAPPSDGSASDPGSPGVRNESADGTSPSTGRAAAPPPRFSQVDEDDSGPAGSERGLFGAFGFRR